MAAMIAGNRETLAVMTLSSIVRPPARRRVPRADRPATIKGANRDIALQCASAP